MNAPMSSLVKTALFITSAGCGSLLAIRWMIQSYIRQSATYKEAVECFRSNPNVLEILGEPIKEKRVDIGDSKYYGHKDNVMWVSVPLKGKKHDGYLHYWVVKEDPTVNAFKVTKVEFEVTGSQGNRITLKDGTSETPLLPARGEDSAAPSAPSLAKTFVAHQ